MSAKLYLTLLGIPIAVVLGTMFVVAVVIGDIPWSPKCRKRR